MTREEMKYKIKKPSLHGRLELHNEAVDACYDEFESRTCENCKYVEYGDYMCCGLVDNAFSKGERIFKAIVNKSMSCNNFVSTDTKGWRKI